MEKLKEIVKSIMMPIMFYACTLSACNTGNSQELDNQNKDWDFEFPNDVDGEIDTGWEFYHYVKQTCTSPLECELYDRTMKDTYAVQLLQDAILAGEAEQHVAGVSRELFDKSLNELNNDNGRWLSKTVATNGWFKISSFGYTADTAAFFLLQHSSNHAFQKEMLSILLPLAEQGETSKGQVALLSDRVAILDDQPQMYGSQGRCISKNIWEPFDILDPENLNVKRAQMDLNPIEEYVAELSGFC